MKLKGEKSYYFGIPLLEINIKKYSIFIPEQYGFCSIYYPSKIQDNEDYLYLIKVYDFFDAQIKINYENLVTKKLLFGESRYIPYIVTRGEAKWVLLGEQSNIRKLEEFPDLKLSSLNIMVKPEDRNWFLLKKSGLNQENLYQYEKSYEEVRHLEFGDEMSEVSVKLRIYIELLKREFIKRRLQLDIDEWKTILFDIIVREPSTKKSTKDTIKNDFIESYIYDYLDVWSSPIWVKL